MKTHDTLDGGTAARLAKYRAKADAFKPRENCEHCASVKSGDYRNENGDKRTLCYYCEPRHSNWREYKESLTPCNDINPPHDNGKRFIENYAANGIRLAGTVHDLCPRLIDHTGWYTDNFQDELIVGAVFLLPGKDGHARAFPGYLDPNNDGCALIDFAQGELVNCREGEPDSSDWRDVAATADRIAERAAKESRAYNAAWQSGNDYARNLGEIADVRKDMRETAKAARDNISGNEKIYAVLRDRIAASRRVIHRLIEENESLANGDNAEFSFWTGDKDLCAAFNDAAGREVLK